MRRTLNTLSLIVASALALGACGGDDDSDSAGSTATGDFPMTVENCGREITFEEPPERVLAMGGEGATLLFAAGAADRISAFAEVEAEPLGAAEPAVADVPEKLGDATELSREVIIGAQPDVVITFSLNQIPPEDLASAGIETLFVSGYCEEEGFPLDGDPSAFELLYSDIELYGQLFGTEDTAAGAVSDLRERVAAVEEQSQGAPESSAAALFVPEEGALSGYGNQSMVHEQMGILGLRNVFGDEDGRNLELNVEEIVDRDPEEVIALFQADQSTAESTREELRSREAIADVEAVRNGDILPLDFFFTGHGTLAVEGLERLSEQLAEPR